MRIAQGKRRAESGKSAAASGCDGDLVCATDRHELKAAHCRALSRTTGRGLLYALGNTGAGEALT